MSDGYVLNSTPLVHTPGFFRWCLAIDRNTFNAEAQDIGAKLYMLCNTWPQIPGGVWLILLSEDSEVTYEIDEAAGTVTINVPDSLSD